MLCPNRKFVAFCKTNCFGNADYLMQMFERDQGRVASRVWTADELQALVEAPSKSKTPLSVLRVELVEPGTCVGHAWVQKWDARLEAWEVMQSFENEGVLDSGPMLQVEAAALVARAVADLVGLSGAPGPTNVVRRRALETLHRLLLSPRGWSPLQDADYALRCWSLSDSGKVFDSSSLDEADGIVATQRAVEAEQALAKLSTRRSLPRNCKRKAKFSGSGRAPKTVTWQ